MPTKLFSAIAVMCLIGTTAVAQRNDSQTNTTKSIYGGVNQYLVPNVSGPNNGANQEVPIITSEQARGFSNSTRNLPVSNKGLNSNVIPSTNPGFAPSSVGGDYFQGGGGDCGQGNCGGGGCGQGGCGGGGCGQGDCGGGGGSYGDCNSCCSEKYVRVFGGWNDLASFQLGPGTAPLDFNFRDGWGMGIASGEYLNSNLRREVEFAYRHNSGDNLSVNGQLVNGLTGNIQAFTGMANLVYELNNLNLGGLRPYVGGGLGLAYVDADLAAGAATYAISDAAFAYQGFAGLEKQVGCDARAFIEYRFLGTTDLDLEAGGGSTDVNYEASSVFIGLHFRK